PFDIEVVSEIQVLFRALEHRAVMHEARTIEEHVDDARERDGSLYAGCVPHVQTTGLDPGMLLQRRELLSIDVRCDDARARCGECQRGRTPYSLRCGSDERRLALQRR